MISVVFATVAEKVALESKVIVPTAEPARFTVIITLSKSVLVVTPPSNVISSEDP